MITSEREPKVMVNRMTGLPFEEFEEAITVLTEFIKSVERGCLGTHVSVTFVFATPEKNIDSPDISNGSLTAVYDLIKSLGEGTYGQHFVIEFIAIGDTGDKIHIVQQYVATRIKH